ncbi:MAG: exodeoxyribonuclease VII small subunit [Fuerstiella sp.]
MAKKKAAAKKKPEKVNLEAALIELEAIANELESGTENLDESIEHFERGMHLMKSCNHQLDEAQRRIEVVTNVDPDGNVTTEPFGDIATIDQSEQDEDSSANPLFDE